MNRAPPTLDLLSQGTMEPLGLLPGASNFTFLVRVSSGGRSSLAVYKPVRGESPLWDFPEGTLAAREVAAHRVARALGWPDVPPTVFRDGPHGPGAVQSFVDVDPAEHYFTLRERRADEFRRVAAFDVVANNADRKAGHCLLGRDGRVWCIDHGLCFSVEPKLRTVIWEFAGQPVPGDLLEDVGRVTEELRTGSLRDELLRLMSEDEVDATLGRGEALGRLGRYPMPGPGRSEPWPPI